MFSAAISSRRAVGRVYPGGSEFIARISDFANIGVGLSSEDASIILEFARLARSAPVRVVRFAIAVIGFQRVSRAAIS
jgi:hypothetical protein